MVTGELLLLGTVSLSRSRVRLGCPEQCRLCVTLLRHRTSSGLWATKGPPSALALSSLWRPELVLTYAGSGLSTGRGGGVGGGGGDEGTQPRGTSRGSDRCSLP